MTVEKDNNKNLCLRQEPKKIWFKYDFLLNNEETLGNKSNIVTDII